MGRLFVMNSLNICNVKVVSAQHPLTPGHTVGDDGLLSRQTPVHVNGLTGNKTGSF